MSVTDPGQELSQMMAEGRSFSSHERNCCFLNTVGEHLDGDRFATISAISGLDIDDDSRALAAVDWDHDGDLDLWISNRNAPRLRFFRNQTGNRQRFVQFQLRGNGTDTNTAAIGARVLVELKPTATTAAQPSPGNGAARRLIRTVVAGDGFQTQSSLVVHFGLGEIEEIERVTVQWPNAEHTVEVFAGCDANHRYELVQGSGAARQLPERTEPLALSESPPAVPADDGRHRIPLIYPVEMPELGYYGFDRQPHDVVSNGADAILINLWSTTCKPCLAELQAFTQRAAELQAAGVRVVALSVDELETGNPDSVAAAQAMAERLGLPFEVGLAPPVIAEQLRQIHNFLIRSRRPLPMPCSFLINRAGKLEFIYKGPVEVATVIADATPFPGDARAYQTRAASFPGTVIDHPVLNDAWERNRSAIRYQLAKYLVATQQLAAAEREYRAILQEWPEAARIANDLGVVLLRQGDPAAAVAYLQQAVQQEPEIWDYRFNLIRALGLAGNPAGASAVAREALQAFPENPAAHLQVGIAQLRERDLPAAQQAFRRVVELDPQHAQGRFMLGKLLLDQGDLAGAMTHLRVACDQSPGEPAPHVALGEAYVRANQFAAAEPVLRRAVQQDGSQPAARYWLGMALGGLTRYADAAAEFQAALQADPNFPGAREALQRAQKASLAPRRP